MNDIPITIDTGEEILVTSSGTIRDRHPDGQGNHGPSREAAAREYARKQVRQRMAARFRARNRWHRA